MFAEMFPSSLSLAVAAYETVVPASTVMSPAGALRLIVGTVLLFTNAACRFTIPPVTHRPLRAATGRVVLIIRLLTCWYVHDGFCPYTAVTTPATCGVAIDVPERLAYELVG